jgi:CP family cyanate transporter-like MFS transporter
MLFLAALALRPPIVGIGPLIPEIRDSLDLTHAFAGLLVAVPVICLGLFALPGGWVVGRYGLFRAMAASLLVAGLLGLARAVAADGLQLLAGTIGVGAALGLAGALLPGAVKASVTRFAGLATGVYAVGIQLGAALSAVLAVPLSAAFGWRGALAAFSALAIVVFAGWLVGTRGTLPRRPARVQHLPLPFRRRRAWHLAAIFSINSVCFWGIAAWLPTYLVELGTSPAAAGLQIAVLNLVSLPATLLVPWLSDRARARRPFLAAAGVVLAAAIAGVIVAPAAVSAWMVLAGVALGSMFTLSLTLPVDSGEDAVAVAGLAAVMLAGGYAVAATGPALLGLVRDLTGSFVPALVLLIGVALIQIPLAVRLPARVA